MNLIARVIRRDLPREVHTRALGRAVGARTGGGAGDAEDGGDVDDPAAVAGGVRGLAEELGEGVFAAVEDACAVDAPSDCQHRGKGMESLSKGRGICSHHLFPMFF